MDYFAGGGTLVLALPWNEGAGSGITYSLASYASVQTDDDVTALDRAAAQLYSSGYSGQIIFVGGTQQDGAFWPKSDFVSGAATVLAPAVEILSLAHRTFTSGEVTYTGTSFATPLVAGVAALLYAFDSTLTAAQVKDYIVRGSQTHLAANGTRESTPKVTTPTGDNAWMLDAYGALTLASGEHKHTPICGFPVGIDQSTPGTVILKRRPSADSSETIAIPGADYLINVSVAQGGRVIAAGNYPTGDPATRRVYQVQYPEMTSLSTLQGVAERRFLEQDTADITITGPSAPFMGLVTLTVRRADRSRKDYAVSTAVGGATATLRLGVSPTGDWASVLTQWLDQSVNPPHSHGSWNLVTLPLSGSGASTPLSDDDLTPLGAPPPAVEEYATTWSHDGAQALVTRVLRTQLSPPIETDVRRIQFVQGQPVIGGEQAFSEAIFLPGFSSNDSILVTGRAPFLLDNCDKVYRVAATLAESTYPSEPAANADLPSGCGFAHSEWTVGDPSAFFNTPKLSTGTPASSEGAIQRE